MSTLVENVAKVTAAHAALKEAITAKGVDVPDGVKLTDMPALVEQIIAEPVPTNPRAVFAGDKSTSLVVPKALVVADMSKITDLSQCFFYCDGLTSLTLPDGFGQVAANLHQCFFFCHKLTSLTLPDGFGQAATDLFQCFYYCRGFTSLILPDGFGQAATDLTQCFFYCDGLTSLTLPDGFGQAVTVTKECFRGCVSLTTITGNPNFKVALDLASGTNLTHDTLMVVINGLETVTTTQTLILGSTNLAKLTDDEKKVATDKGWTLA